MQFRQIILKDLPRKNKYIRAYDAEILVLKLFNLKYFEKYNF